MKNRLLIDQHESLNALIKHINQYSAWRRCQLAGRYAYEMTAANYRTDDELADDYFAQDGGDSMFVAHLNLLAKHGCRLTKRVALEWAKGYANLPFDLGD